MNSMKVFIPLLYWSIHTKDEGKHGTAFAFIFGVNWLWRSGGIHDMCTSLHSKVHHHMSASLWGHVSAKRTLNSTGHLLQTILYYPQPLTLQSAAINLFLIYSSFQAPTCESQKDSTTAVNQSRRQANSQSEPLWQNEPQVDCEPWTLKRVAEICMARATES